MPGLGYHASKPGSLITALPGTLRHADNVPQHQLTNPRVHTTDLNLVPFVASPSSFKPLIVIKFVRFEGFSILDETDIDRLIPEVCGFPFECASFSFYRKFDFLCYQYHCLSLVCKSITFTILYQEIMV